MNESTVKEKESVQSNGEASNGEWEVWITTIDNPWDPLNSFPQWFEWDTINGYNTCAYVARICKIDDTFSDAEEFASIEDAIDEIIKYDFLNIYKKVKRFIPA